MERGIAIDIGTTTIAGSLVEIATGLVLGTSTLPNPQARWGSDVLSRIKAAEEGPGALGELTGSLVEALNGLIRGLGAEGVVGITAAGNSVMEHILLGVSPAPLARPPYRPAFTEARVLPASEVGLEVNSEIPLYVFPLIGGFVGGDAVAVALHLGLGTSAGNTLAIDIGTNSEIILGAGGSLFATSAAAGPAFEAGGIRYGMTARRGAIEGVETRGESVRLDVIGGVAPVGICGSGLVEAASALLKAGVMDASGRIKDPDEVDTNLSVRIKAGEEGNSFVLYKGASGTVTLTQADIRSLQVAKSAIRAGVSVVLKKAGIGPVDIDSTYIAGAFGSSLKPEGLAAIGLLDAVWAENTEFIGDAALKGAELALRNDKKAEAGELARKTRYVPLSGSRHFEKEFIRNMDF